MIGKNLMKHRYLKKKRKKDFHSHLNMEDITDAGYVDAKRVGKDFKIRRISGFVCSQ